MQRLYATFVLEYAICVSYIKLTQKEKNINMIPSPRWFPTTLQERAAWYNNFNTQIQLIGVTLGLGPAELSSISDDNDDMQFLATSAVTLDAYVDAVRTHRRVITEGNIGDPTPVFPASIALAFPITVQTGMFERLDGFVKRIRVAAAFTEEAGASLGINPSGGGPSIPVGDVPPVITATVDPGNIVEVKFVKNHSDGIYIETNVDGGGWTFTEKAIKSPAVFHVEVNTGNTPRGVQIRARFLDGNAPVGDWCDIVTVQTIP